MSESAKSAREAMKAKAKRLTTGDPSQKVDSSTWSPPAPENADKQTGARPLVKRLYKKGGKVTGEKADFRADRKPRKAGGRATRYLTPDNLINRDVRMANDVREDGNAHLGAFKKGGKIHKMGGGTFGENPLSLQNRSMAKAAGMMKKGGVAHPDEAEDKALIRKMVKPSARTGKAGGGSKFDSPTHSFKMKLSNGEDTTTHNLSMPGESAANALVNAVKFANKGGWNVDNIEHTGSSAGAGSSAGMMKKGGKVRHREDGGTDDIAKKIRQDEIEQGMKGRGQPSPVPMPPSRPVEKQKPYTGPIPDWAKKMADKRGGAVKWEGSAKDESQDRILAKKYGISMKKWEASEADEKHDKQHSMKGLKRGGSAHGDDCSCKMCGGGRTMKYGGGGVFSGDSLNKIPGAVGGRKAHAKGGKAKTNVNIIIGAHGGQPQGGMPNAPVPAPMSQRIPPNPQGGGMPMPPPGMMPSGGPQGAPPMPPPGMMPRKSGGRTNYPIDTGAGGGNARLEKIPAYGLKPPRGK
jgi:hypothetical protein